MGGRARSSRLLSDGRSWAIGPVSISIGMGLGDHNIVQKAFVDLNIPVATATLLNPLDGARP